MERLVFDPRLAPELLVQLTKLYPVFGVAIKVIVSPCWYWPPELLTVPPSEEETDRVYSGIFSSKFAVIDIFPLTTIVREVFVPVAFLVLNYLH